MKKLLVLVLAIAMVLSLVACAPTTPSEEPTAAPEATEAPVTPTEAPAQTIVIGYSFPTANNEFWGNSLTYMQEAATALGIELKADDCNNDQAEQLNDVESMISSGIQGLVLAPQDASVCAGITASCKAKGIPVVIVDRWPGDELKAGDDYIAFIGPNDIEAGYQIAMSLINGGCTKLVGIGGFQNTSVAEGRKAGLDKALAEHPEVELLQYEWAGENWDVGDATFRNMLQANKDLDGVWCYNDSLALAAVNVAKENDLLGKVKVGGMDLLGPAVDSMKAGELWFSTGGHYLQSAFGMVVVYDAINGIEYTGEPRISLNLLNVSQDNLDKFVAKYQSGGEPIDWKNLSKVNNPDAKVTFELTLD